MTAANLSQHPSQLAATLPVPGLESMTRARAATRERLIDYALGSGEADEVGLFAGIKPLLRQLLPATEVARVRERFTALGLFVEEARHVTSPSGPASGSVLFISRDRRRAEAAAQIEGLESHDVEMGRLLGYPRCCVDAYLEAPPPRSNLAVAMRARNRTLVAGARFSPRLNVLDLAVFHYTSWLPCSFACAPSRAYADAVAVHISRRHGQFVGRVPGGAAVARTICPPGCRHQIFVARCDEALSAHRLVLFEDVQLSLTGPSTDAGIAIERVWPTARDRHPAAQLDGDAAEAVARLLAIIQCAARVAVEGDVLLVDGEPRARTPAMLLLPFASR